MCTEMLAFLFTTICTFRQRFGPTIEFFNTVKIHKSQIIWVRMLYLYGKTYPVLPEMEIFLPEPVRERLLSSWTDDVIFRTGCPSSLVSENMLLCIHDLSHDGKLRLRHINYVLRLMYSRIILWCYHISLYRSSLLSSILYLVVISY